MNNYNLLENINTIDYAQPWTDKSSFFDVELSFTLLDMRIMELILKDDNFSVQDIEIEQAIQLCFNIWPGGRGILHKLALGVVSDDDTLINQKEQQEGN